MVTWSVEQVDAGSVILELEHGGRHGDTPVFFHLHPVTGGGVLVLARRDASRQVNCTSVEQKLFRQRGFTGIRVGNDCKSAAPIDFVGDVG